MGHWRASVAGWAALATQTSVLKSLWGEQDQIDILQGLVSVRSQVMAVWLVAS